MGDVAHVRERRGLVLSLLLKALMHVSDLKKRREPMSSTISRMRTGMIVFAIVAPLALGGIARAVSADNVGDADKTVKLYKKTDPGLATFFDNSAGYAVFPGIAKGGAGLGGAYGKGILFEKGKAIGRTTLTQMTAGLQLGGQTYSEIIFFESDKALKEFKGSNFAFSAQASAVALKSGASVNAKYRDGVAVVSATKAGLMFEASVGGQKFTFEPFSRS
jgi:lipid-binding SYLF domain-containing protein